MVVVINNTACYHWTTSSVLDVLVLSRRKEEQFSKVSKKIDKPVSLRKSGKEFHRTGE